MSRSQDVEISRCRDMQDVKNTYPCTVLNAAVLGRTSGMFLNSFEGLNRTYICYQMLGVGGPGPSLQAHLQHGAMGCPHVAGVGVGPVWPSGVAVGPFIAWTGMLKAPRPNLPHGDMWYPTPCAPYHLGDIGAGMLGQKVVLRWAHAYCPSV